MRIYVDKQTDLSRWLKGTPTSYKFNLKLEGAPAGNYSWAVGLVDVTKRIILVYRWLLVKVCWSLVG